ncbi:MAG TPA: MBL fold metallo-hydrolase [Ignavibacteriaceae bacterium]|nr:MBL fold metallo-hydrolase [Ignavibacteriaceae bacterium]
MSNLFIIALAAAIAASAYSQENFVRDTIPASGGDLIITFIGHGTLIFNYGGKIIHVDPYSKLADYSTLPKADIILITHHHGDHLDPKAIEKIRTEKTVILLTKTASEQLKEGTVMNNGDKRTIDGIQIEAVPAYNIQHKRDNGEPFHPKGIGNGYVITFGNKRVYVAGDTENIPEMKSLKNIDIAFLPMNLPYTMTPEMTADAAKSFKPKILYPYHFGDTDLNKLTVLMKDTPGIEVRLRKMN